MVSFLIYRCFSFPIQFLPIAGEPYIQIGGLSGGSCDVEHAKCGKDHGEAVNIDELSIIS